MAPAESWGIRPTSRSSTPASRRRSTNGGTDETRGRSLPGLVFLGLERLKLRRREFSVKGNGLLLVNEAGYQRPSSAAAHQAWLRVGYMRNSTRYTNRSTGQEESDNYCAYVLMDYQLGMPDPATPGRGLFLGGTAMTVPSELNPYDKYYEARLYQRGPFPSRPTDVLTFVAAYRGHGRAFTDGLAAQGKTVWRSSRSVPHRHLHRPRRARNYLSLGLGYVRGPALSPRVGDALTFTVNWSLYL